MNKYIRLRQIYLRNASNDSINSNDNNTHVTNSDISNKALTIRVVFNDKLTYDRVSKVLHKFKIRMADVPLKKSFLVENK